MGTDDVLGSIIPPGLSRLSLWRLAVSGWLFLLLGFACWALGWLPSSFGGGFARADETKQLSQRLQSIESNQRTGLRITLAQEICRLMMLRDGAAGDVRAALADALERHQQEYEKIDENSRRYPLEECGRQR